MSDYAVFLLMSIALILTPGADTVLVTKNTLAYGRKEGAKTAIGTSAGILVHTLAAALGLSAILASSALLFDVVKYIGAAYLLYLGLSSLWSLKKKDVLSLSGNGENVPSNGSCLRQGLLTNVLNPKVAVFFLTFLPQFIDPTGNVLTQIALMGLTYAALVIAWLLIYVFLIDSIRSWFQKSAIQQFFHGITGAVLILFGVKLAMEHR